jgi:DNA ligase-4
MDPVKIFDILYLNDKCLTRKRLSERKRLLQSPMIFPNLGEYKGRLEFAEESRGKTGKDIRAMMERILETRSVGLAFPVSVFLRLIDIGVKV